MRSRFASRLETGRLPRPELRLFADHINFGIPRAPAAAPFQFEDGRKISRLDMAGAVPLTDWVHILQSWAAHLICAPTKLAALLWGGASYLARSPPDERPVIQTQRESAICTPADSTHPAPGCSAISPSHPASPFRVRRLGNSAVARSRVTSVAALWFSAEFESLPQLRLFGDGDRSRIPRKRRMQAHASFAPDVCGSQCYGSFCDLWNARYFHHADDIAQVWPDVCSWARFLFRFRHLWRGCHLLGRPITWLSSSVRVD